MTPLPAGIALAGLGTVLAVAAAASYADPPATVLLGIAALGSFFAGMSAVIRRPRLTLTTGPVLTVRTLRGGYELRPADIASIELLDTRRLAFRSRQLLIEQSDDSGRLLVFGRWDLGENPSIVAEELADAGFTVRRR
ncbi:MAG: PH domain-containing protein [Gordonia sp. (in: high G+C Gram-positive bacteria)]|uniref:PH domain-containing protein n=1 Tax=Gordonia sp. (in: high G+C Gram-positive bacteria) TaxID=84139 RepID=UPI0039E4F38A